MQPACSTLISYPRNVALLAPPADALDRPLQISLRTLMTCTGLAAVAMGLLPAVFGVLATVIVLGYLCRPIGWHVLRQFGPRLHARDGAGRRELYFGWGDAVVDLLSWSLVLAIAGGPGVFVGLIVGAVAVASIVAVFSIGGVYAVLYLFPAGLMLFMAGWLLTLPLQMIRSWWRNRVATGTYVIDLDLGALFVRDAIVAPLDELEAIRIEYTGEPSHQNHRLLLSRRGTEPIAIEPASRRPFFHVADAVAAAQLIAETLRLPVQWHVAGRSSTMALP